MDYNSFCKILNKHIFEQDKKELLTRLAEKPERFIGLFRPTKPKAKLLQYLLQSHEIRMGNAMEEVIKEVLKSLNFKLLPNTLVINDNQSIQIDIYFTDMKNFYFIEQKIRDDHDSTKKRGQMKNFEEKLEILYKMHAENLVGIMYFIDPDLSKNKNFYIEEINKLKKFYGIDIYLFYGRELFEYFGIPEMWDQILLWLKKWKDNLPELPEINLDLNPEENIKELTSIELRVWRKILENEKLWKEGIIKALSKEGKVLLLLLRFFKEREGVAYSSLAETLEKRLEEYYNITTKKS
jgi:hypothetical protein